MFKKFGSRKEHIKATKPNEGELSNLDVPSIK